MIARRLVPTVTPPPRAVVVVVPDALPMRQEPRAVRRMRLPARRHFPAVKR